MRALKQLARRVLPGALRLLPRRRDRRDVLFLCQNGLMADYLGPVWDWLAADARVRCSVTYPRDEELSAEAERIRARLAGRQVRLGWAYLRPWDLIVTADHGYADLADRRRCPVLFTGHGTAGKVVAGEEGDYQYGPRALGPDGRPRYSRMLEASESNRDRVVARNPDFGGVIAVTGNPQDDEVLAMAADREAIRQGFGHQPDDVVVFVMGSWGPHSLFHVLGDPLLAEVERLRGELRFILSIHPHEYRPRSDGGRVWGEHLRRMAGPGVLVREVGTSWMPYLVACDVVLTDHTSLAVYAALLHKPCIYSPVPDDSVAPGTPVAKLRALCRVLDDPRRLHDEVEWARQQFPRERLEALAHEVNSRPGRARELVLREVYGLLGLAMNWQPAGPAAGGMPAPAAPALR